MLAEEGDDIANIVVPSVAAASTPPPPTSAPAPTPAAPKAEPPAPKAAPAPVAAPAPEAHGHPTHPRPLLPSVLRLLSIAGIEDATVVTATGHRGMLTKGDVLAFLGEIPSARGSEKEDVKHAAPEVHFSVVSLVSRVLIRARTGEEGGAKEAAGRDGRRCFPPPHRGRSRHASRRFPGCEGCPGLSWYVLVVVFLAPQANSATSQDSTTLSTNISRLRSARPRKRSSRTFRSRRTRSTRCWDFEGASRGWGFEGFGEAIEDDCGANMLPSSVHFLKTRILVRCIVRSTFPCSQTTWTDLTLEHGTHTLCRRNREHVCVQRSAFVDLELRRHRRTPVHHFLLPRKSLAPAVPHPHLARACGPSLCLSQIGRAHV